MHYLISLDAFVLLINGIAGIQPQEPGFSRIIIRPYLPESMNRFICSYNSVRGKVTVEVQEKNGIIELRLEIPDSIDYTVDTTELEKRGPVTVH